MLERRAEAGSRHRDVLVPSGARVAGGMEPGTHPGAFPPALMESELPGVLQKSSSVGVPGHHAGSTPTLPCTPSPAVQQ